MPITRTFIDWSRPALATVVEDLVDRYTASGHVDLSQVIAVFPGARAGRRFIELLVDRTEGRNTPPRVITVGELPELLYEPKRPFASDLVQQLAWVEALHAVPHEHLAAIVRDAPPEQDVFAWLALGEMLSKQHRELAADGLDFADVATQGADVAGFDEHLRWEALGEVQQAYLKTLDALGLWDRQTARRVAIEKRECRSPGDLVLVGTVDMTRTMRQMLDQAAGRITAFVHAPLKLQRAFDDHGCLIPETWQTATIDLRTEHVEVVDGPDDQVDAVARRLAALGGRYRPDEIAIGVTDERLAPRLRRLLTECGVASDWVVARSLPQTSPYCLLDAVAGFLEGERTDQFAALVRHPDVAQWLAGQGVSEGWLAELDEYLACHLQSRFSQWLGSEGDRQALMQVHQLVRRLLAPLRGAPRPLAEWTQPVIDLLLAIYGRVEFDREDPDQQIQLAACETIYDVLAGHTAVPESLMPDVTGGDALQWTLQEAAGVDLPPRPDEAAVELLGWLELPLDDAPVLVTTTFNEGFVPTSANADLFLPNRLRTQLGLNDNLRRYARDAYALSVLLHSRSETSLIVARRDAAGEPLIPSRLLFAAAPETIARRVLDWFSDPPNRSGLPPLAGALMATRLQSGLEVPRPTRPTDPSKPVSVTSLRDYLASPYRYYLRHILGLEAIDDTIDELSPFDFGNLIHDVLKEFGRSSLKDSTSAGEIQQFLVEQLRRSVDRVYGRDRLAAINVQVEQAVRRLEGFARWQAEWAAEGWRIAFAEASSRDASVPFELEDGRAVLLKGRIDRIDRNDRQDAWYIFDYKTGDRGNSPEKSHRSGGEWVDLQLPLYRRLAAPLGVGGNVRLGYIVLPQNPSDAGAIEAEWTQVDLDEAEAVAREVARGILDQEFWDDNVGSASRDADEFSRICQDGVFRPKPVA